MDVIKAYALEDDGKFRSILKEKALFQTAIDVQGKDGKEKY